MRTAPHPSKARVQAVRALVVGDAMLDRYWFGPVDRISPEAPVPVMRVTRSEERLGGAGNVALNLATLGAQASLLSALGDDEAGLRFAELLAEAGIAALAGPQPGQRTTVKLRVIGRSQQLLRLDFEHPSEAGRLSVIQRAYADALTRHDVVLVSDYGKGALADSQALIRLARGAERPVLVDPKGHDYQRYAGANVITPNKSELAEVIGRWSDEATLTQRAQSLRESLHIDALVLTRAEEGMTLFDGEGQIDVPTVAREVFDVTGAGDTVIATLACMMAAGLPLRHALPIANRAGGLVVGRFGTAGLAYDDLFSR
jgi:rfaE bifunctional protein kinase chain/domain